MTVSALLTQNQRGPVSDPGFQTLMEDLMQKHDGLARKGRQVASNHSDYTGNNKK